MTKYEELQEYLKINQIIEKMIIKNSFSIVNIWASWCLPCRDEHEYLLKLKNIFLLPHLGSATKRTRWDMVYRATKNLEDFFSGKKPQDQVN